MNLARTPEQLAEQAGNAEAESLLELMKLSKTQAARLLLLHALLVELSQSEYSEQALAGFSCAILAHLELGLGIG